VAGIGALNRIHRQCANRVGHGIMHFVVGSHQEGAARVGRGGQT
jgi:hypothetical protein